MSGIDGTLPAAPARRGIRRLMVANRGEIAVRIMRTARAMGIETVAVHSTADRDAPHVAMADLAVCIGEAAPAASYLNVGALLAAAGAAGADAVHPGYGFLSENAGFARACRDAGLCFVGPSPEAIEAMGDKARAKQFMRQAGLPCVPGYDGEAQDAASLAEQAERLGYPVIVKATAGGGGRGMRVVESAAGFAAALASARSEARNAFGDDRMLVERVVRQPRHIEIQVLVDRYGHGIHFGERDCSVQRRHQKVIEEAPAPGLRAEVRDRLGAAAVAAACRLGYEGVGTFEFLLEGDDTFYFMEMNTRLQVEHPVTEAITGHDLVAWQLQVAMGEPLALRQEDVRFEGHAIEVRLCAEDEAQGFLPQSGRIDLWRPPVGVRVEQAVTSGGEITPHYDSMFAKLIAHGRDREEARRKLVAALRDTVVFGPATNREALIRWLEHPEFAAGSVDTGFLARAGEAPGGQDDAGEREREPLALAAVAACVAGRRQGRGPALLFLRDGGGTLQELRVTQLADGTFEVRGADWLLALAWRSLPDGGTRCTLHGVERPVVWMAEGERWHVQWAGRCASFVDATYAAARSAGDGEADGRVRASSNGRVVALLVAEGQAVEPGMALVTVEAMKMEYTHTAPVAGVVSAVHVAAGDSVATGRLLVEIQHTGEPPVEI